jgi:hypothetical protein
VGVGALDDFDDRAFGRPRRSVPMTRASTRSPCRTFLHFLIGQEQVVARLVRDHEAEAVAVRADAAGTKLEWSVNAYWPAGFGADLAVALHRIQPAREHALRGRVDLAGRVPVRRCRAALGIAEDAENFLAAWNGMSWLLQIVFLFLLSSSAPRPCLVALAGSAMLLD